MLGFMGDGNREKEACSFLKKRTKKLLVFGVRGLAAPFLGKTAKGTQRWPVMAGDKKDQERRRRQTPAHTCCPATPASLAITGHL
jgi:hypothetical protein